MMKNVLKMTMLLCLLMGIGQVGNAQKIGYINYALLVSDFPEKKSADATLDAFQKQLQKKGQQMIEAYQTKAQELAKKEKAGELSPKQLDEEGKKLKDEEAKIGQFEQEATKQIQTKQEELYKPISDKINMAIKDVAKEKGYQFIFDLASNVMLYYDETHDMTKIVKTKLGIAAN